MKSKYLKPQIKVVSFTNEPVLEATSVTVSDTTWSKPQDVNTGEIGAKSNNSFSSSVWGDEQE